MTGVGLRNGSRHGEAVVWGWSRSHRAMKGVTGMEKNTGGVTEDNQRGGNDFSCSGVYLSSSTPTSCVFFFFPSALLFSAHSSALFALDNAVRSPLSLCDGGMARGVRGGDEAIGGLRRRKTHARFHPEPLPFASPLNVNPNVTSDLLRYWIDLHINTVQRGKKSPLF